MLSNLLLCSNFALHWHFIFFYQQERHKIHVSYPFIVLHCCIRAVTNGPWLLHISNITAFLQFLLWARSSWNSLSTPLKWKTEKSRCALLSFTAVISLFFMKKRTCSLNLQSTYLPLLFISDITSLLVLDNGEPSLHSHLHLVFQPLPLCILYACLLPAAQFCFCVVCSRAEKRTVCLPDERDNFPLLLLSIMLLPDQRFDVSANTTWKWPMSGSGRRSRFCQKTTKNPTGVRH